MPEIPVHEITVDATSYVDPTGRLLAWDGELYRAIGSGRAEFFRALVEDQLFTRMQEQGRVVETRVTEHTLEGFDLVLWHKTLSPRTYCVEWPPQMLRAAARLTLELCLELLPRGWTLQDAYPWNVLFQGTRPVFVDVGSVTPVEPRFLWRAYQQFCNFFLFPLYLCSAGLGSVSRRLLYDYLQGVTPELCQRLLPRGFSLRHPQSVSRLGLPLAVSRWTRRLGLEEKLESVHQDMDARVDLGAARERLFKGLLRDLEAIRLPVAKTVWSEYQAWPDWDAPDTWGPKQRRLAEILDRIKPASVIDVACNLGWYSVLAARGGARVVAFDQDESCVSKLFAYADKHGHDVTPLVVDLLNPAPAFGWRLRQFPSLLDRVQGELVMALALIHHLVITQWQNFDRVVRLLGDLSGRWLLVEFVPLSDDMAQILLRHAREEFEWYTLENFLEAMRRCFGEPEVFDSEPEGRKLVLAERTVS